MNTPKIDWIKIENFSNNHIYVAVPIFMNSVLFFRIWTGGTHSFICNETFRTGFTMSMIFIWNKTIRTLFAQTMKINFFINLAF